MSRTVGGKPTQAVTSSRPVLTRLQRTLVVEYRVPGGSHVVDPVTLSNQLRGGIDIARHRQLLSRAQATGDDADAGVPDRKRGPGAAR